MLKEQIAELIHKRMAGSCCWESAHESTREYYYKIAEEAMSLTIENIEIAYEEVGKYYEK